MHEISIVTGSIRATAEEMTVRSRRRNFGSFIMETDFFVASANTAPKNIPAFNQKAGISYNEF